MPAIATVVVVALVAHVVAQRAAGTTACCRTDQATGVAADTTTDHVAAGCAQRAANGRFASAAFVCAHCATAGAAQGRTNGRTGIAADLLADD